NRQAYRGQNTTFLNGQNTTFLKSYYSCHGDNSRYVKYPAAATRYHTDRGTTRVRWLESIGKPTVVALAHKHVHALRIHQSRTHVIDVGLPVASLAPGVGFTLCGKRDRPFSLSLHAAQMHPIRQWQRGIFAWLPRHSSPPDDRKYD
ncbi:hypothetical protein, partial [Burkholderia ubonensis]|uniref:hypothetical protein n=1 Tax=Burkholderia ubonensis TaxID=101571 RepID=UPI001E4ED89F